MTATAHHHPPDALPESHHQPASTSKTSPVATITTSNNHHIQQLRRRASIILVIKETDPRCRHASLTTTTTDGHATTTDEHEATTTTTDDHGHGHGPRRTATDANLPPTATTVHCNVNGLPQREDKMTDNGAHDQTTTTTLDQHNTTTLPRPERVTATQHVPRRCKDERIPCVRHDSIPSPTSVVFFKTPPIVALDLEKEVIIKGRFIYICVPTASYAPMSSKKGLSHPAISV
ncbi:uncharacterized protein LACBIDRAFT_332863 [Laccaria bicolor S238N-H82]|uniref:Predicted protein n=1 Tax=Laccaria bicolor (strain S238N-H82 / ATCC MYA-4686) TaxID=486041 RepID=B0DU39_LACBS|nr:uncharacterized protein LACBIDRAFT_332863 [Laccaria bicolor S238N-H82]EDR01881.1 predicted protein [Laccaria bicolor S238N-H82]|eukprot:XP_001887491.1 predicted protein [Laccaria bicolor S238N-H82]